MRTTIHIDDHLFAYRLTELNSKSLRDSNAYYFARDLSKCPKREFMSRPIDRLRDVDAKKRL